MGLSNEDIVTQLLSKQEILGIGMSNFALKEKTPMYKTKSAYNLGVFLNKSQSKPSKFGAKYMFVK